MNRAPRIRGWLLLATVATAAVVFLLWPRLRQKSFPILGGKAPPRMQASDSRATTEKETRHSRVRPPKLIQPLPLYFVRTEHARDAFPDSWYAQTLTVRERKGPFPTSLEELKKLPEFDKSKLEELSEEDVEFRLKLLGDLDACFQAAQVPPGSAVVRFDFAYDKSGKGATAHKSLIEASAIEPHALQAFQTCLDQTFVSRHIDVEQQPGSVGHAWPTTITVPVRNHSLFHYLLPEGSAP